MEENEHLMSEVSSLRKQIRLLAIFLFGSWIVLVLLLVAVVEARILPRSSITGWPDLSADTLQVKKIVLMTKDDRPAGAMTVMDGRASLDLLDGQGDSRILLVAAKKSGIVELDGGESGSTYFSNGRIVMGTDKAGAVLILGPHYGGPSMKVVDSAGYSACLGRSSLTDSSDGTVSLTSAASLTGGSSGHVYSWSLLSGPVLTKITTGKPGENSLKPSPKGARRH